MRHLWIFFVLVAFVACDCGRKEEVAPVAYEPLKETAPSEAPVAPRMSDADCERLLSAKDLEQICGIDPKSVSGKNGKKGSCVRRFKSRDSAVKRSIVLTVWEEGSAGAAGVEYARRQRQVQKEPDYQELSGVGAAAHAFMSGGRKRGKGPAVLAKLDGRVLEVRAPHDPEHQPLCTAANLAELMKRVVQHQATPAGQAEAPVDQAAEPPADEASARQPEGEAVADRVDDKVGDKAAEQPVPSEATADDKPAVP